MSEALKKYQVLLAEIKAEKGYKPNMGAAGKALLAECVQAAKQRKSLSNKAYKSKPIIGRTKMTPRATFSSLQKNMYKCKGLNVDACTVAPHCFYQPKAKRCMLRSGKNIVSTFGNHNRKSVLAQLINEDTPHGYFY